MNTGKEAPREPSSFYLSRPLAKAIDDILLNEVA